MEMIFLFVVLGFARCQPEQMVSFPLEANASDGFHIDERITWPLKDSDRKESSEISNKLQDNLIHVKPGSKNIAFLPVIIPSAPSTIFPPLPVVPSPFPVYGVVTTGEKNVMNPFQIDFGTKLEQVKPALWVTSPTTVCSCMSLESCVKNTAFNVITTRIVTNPPLSSGCLPGQVYCCIENTKLGCGIPNIVPGVKPAEGQAQLGQNPWSAVILTASNAYVGGGVLIDANHVLTVAHRLTEFKKDPGLKVRLGDWDLSSDSEPIPFLEVKVSKIIFHPLFDEATLRNDIAIIVLAMPVATLTKPHPQINSICLPEPMTDFTGLRCKVAGWGKDQFNGKYQTILKEVDVPILSPIECQAKLRSTKLGPSFVLDVNSFLCAGGEHGKDACTGDGGNALACMKDGKFFVAGLTAAGIECGNPNVPGLYVNLVNYVAWIRSTIKGSDAIVINPRGNRP